MISKKMKKLNEAITVTNLTFAQIRTLLEDPETSEELKKKIREEAKKGIKKLENGGLRHEGS